MRYMLDTNICIYLIKGRPPQIPQRLRSLREGEAVISAVTYAELRAGFESQTAMRAHDERILGLLIQRIPVLPFEESAAVAFGVMRAMVRDRRRDALDRLIAAHAISIGAVLVTNNEAGFDTYPGLTVEDWTREP